MKKLSLLALAVAFAAIYVFFPFSAQAGMHLESRVMKIAGETNVVTEQVDDEGNRKVVDVVELPNKKENSAKASAMEEKLVVTMPAKIAGRDNNEIQKKSGEVLPVAKQVYSAPAKAVGAEYRIASKQPGEVLPVVTEKVDHAPVKVTDARYNNFQKKSGEVLPVAKQVYSAPAKAVGAEYRIASKQPGEVLPVAKTAQSEGRTIPKLLSNWEVREQTFQVDKRGNKELVRDYLRSPAECYDRVKPGYKKTGSEYTVRYDRHVYDDPVGHSVLPGTVVHYALDDKPNNLIMKHIVRDSGDKMEILQVETSQFITVDKPRAQEVKYLTPYDKSFKTVRVMPTDELYKFTNDHRVSEQELENIRGQYAQIRAQKKL